MKLRIRVRKTTSVITLNDDAEKITIQDLKSRIVNELHLSECDFFDLSLNGHDKLTLSDDDTVQTVGLVSGDLLYVLSLNLPESTGDVSTTCTVNSRPALLESQTSSTPVLFEKSTDNTNHMDTGIVATTQPPDGACVGQSSTNEDMDTMGDLLMNRYLSEPMLCRDSSGGRVPHKLESLYESADVQSAQDAAVVILHALMMEVGFTASGNSSSVTGGNQAVMPTGWRGSGVYRILYNHVQFPEEECYLVCTTLGRNVLVLHGLISGEHCCGRCLSIQCSEFISDIGSNPGQVYSNISKLSRLFKDALACPLLSHIKEALNIDDYQCLVGVPYEVKLSIFRHLDVASLLRLSQVSRLVNSVCNDNWLWRHLYLKDFGRRGNHGLQQSWKELYKETYRKRKEHRRRMRHMFSVVPPYVGQPHAPHPFTPVYPPGVIGGDYDLDPHFPGVPGTSGHIGNPLLLPRPRFDPFNPLPDTNFGPGRGQGPRKQGHPLFYRRFGPLYF